MATALVTGAGHGIGAALARALAARGHDLILVARSPEPLHAVAAELTTRHAVGARVLPADLTLPADLERVADAAHDTDILVNNAGASLSTPFHHTPWADEHHLLALNVLAPTRLLHAALPHMLRRGHGRVLTVSSIAALGPAWRGSTYGPAKAYQLALTESLAHSHRIRASPVTVTALVLGYVASDFHAHAGIDAPPAPLTLTCPYVAEQAVRALHRRRPPAVCVPSIRYKVLSHLMRHAPRRLITASGLARDFTTPTPGNGRPPAPRRETPDPARRP